jgi:hypothetical protein
VTTTTESFMWFHETASVLAERHDATGRPE